MKKIITLLILTALIPVQLLAADNDKEPIKVSFKEYNGNAKKYLSYLSNTTELLGLIDEMKLSSGLFLKKLGKGGRKVIIADDQEEADFQVFFIGRKVPTLPKNKHHETNTIPYRFNSQWMEGELYLKDKKVVGGNIVIRIPSHTRLKELYYILEGKWNKIPMKIEEQGYTFGMLIKITDEYEKATKKYEAREKRLDGKPWETPSKEEVDKMFSKKGETTLMIAQLLRITPPRIHAYISGVQTKKCKTQSKDFYSKLHAHLFDQILEQAANNADSDIIHDITPSEKIFQKLHNASGDYNCFITNSKLTEFSR